MWIIMNKAVLGITILFITALPFIALVMIIAFKVYRKFRPAKAKAGIETQGERKEPLLPPTPASLQRTALIFIGITLLIIVYGVMTGITVGVFSHLIYIVFLFPVVMGINSGKLIADVIQRAKVRKTSQLIFFSLLSAVTIYGTFHYCRYVGLQIRTSLEMFPGLSQATEGKNLRLAKAFLDYALKEETGYSGFAGYMLYRASEGVSIGRLFRSSSLNLGPILSWSYWSMEFGIILWLTFQKGKKMMDTAFCTSCGSWYSGEKHLGGTAAANETFLQDLIKQKDFIELGKLMDKNAEVPSLEVYFQGCEACKQSHSHLVVRHAFQGPRGGLQFRDASKILLQPHESALLLSQLKFIEN
jgi:hypothetical protein